MVKLRRGFFETNSSSAHAFCKHRTGEIPGDISINDWRVSIYGDILYIGELEFGREFHYYDSPQDKLRYYFASLEAWKYDGSGVYGRRIQDKIISDFLKVVQTHLPKVNHIGWTTSGGDYARPVYVTERNGDVLWTTRHEYVHDGEEHPSELNGYFRYCHPDGRIDEFICPAQKKLLRVESHEPHFGGIDGESKGMLKRWMEETGVTPEEFIFSSRYSFFTDSDETVNLKRMVNRGIIQGDEIESLWCDEQIILGGKENG